jgi:hypothetical protein
METFLLIYTGKKENLKIPNNSKKENTLRICYMISGYAQG